MSYERSLTYAAKMEIDRYVEQQIAKADAQLDRQQTAEELLEFLLDGTKLATPGFVLRRHIQAQGGLVSKETCADLSQCGNVPWPEEVVYQAAVELSSISYRRHGLAISTVQWERYLASDMPQGLQRDMIFKLAIVTGMGREATIDLLMACGQPTYNMRSPLELICWFCQYVPGIYTWKGVKLLMDKYKMFYAAADKDPGGKSQRQEPKKDTTHLLRWSVDEILEAGDPAGEAERKLLELMGENCGELEGFSGTARSAYLRLLDYLSVLYPEGTKTLRKLTNAMFERQEWKFEDIHQTSTKDRYVFRGWVEDEAASREVDYIFDAVRGKIALFCKRYYDRASAIRSGGRDVDRWDVLLLGYFLITGYMEASAETRDGFWNMTKERASGKGRGKKDGRSMDDRMKRLRNDLNALRPDSDMKEKKVLCRRVLNELLAQFGFRALYVPAPFDRFIFLCLLTDSPAWTARYLLGEELED